MDHASPLLDHTPGSLSGADHANVYPLSGGVVKGQLFAEGRKWIELDMHVEHSQACLGGPVPQDQRIGEQDIVFGTGLKIKTKEN